MAELELVIKGGTVATAGGVVECDVGLRSGRVAMIADEIVGGAAKVIDAHGKIVMPGGIDSHCHIAQVSSFGLETADDFESGTRSAAAGGTTCIIPFAVQRRNDSLREKVEAYHACATGKAIIDYAFHLIVADPTERILDIELPELIKEGFTSFKIYMTYDALKLDDFEILKVLTVARRHGAMVMVHAENHAIIGWLTKSLLEAGKTQPRYHAMAHAATAESEATHRVIALAGVVDVPILIVHVSTRAAIDEIARARERGLRIYSETCPQYLFLTADDMNLPGFEGAKFVCSPPLRKVTDQDHIWRALETGILDIFSSDHAPYRYSGTDGKAAASVNAPFHKIANGVPGLEVRLPLLFSEGVRTGRLSIETFVELTATRAAKLYGLYPRKGTIAVGSDADIAIWDADCEVTISSSNLHDNMDYTPYEGKKITGWPVLTLSRGKVVWDGNNVIGKPGQGRFLTRNKPWSSQTSGKGLLDNIE